MSEVYVGKEEKDKLSVIANKTQVYGLAGNDTLVSNGKNDVLLVGGSGDDVLSMTGGAGTLSGGTGKDTFYLNYSAEQKISAVIEDIDPTNDKIIITYGSSSAPKLSHSVSGDDVIWTDANGNFNLTLKGSNAASDYYEGTAHDYIWDVFWIVNRERESYGLNPLTLSQGLMDGASVRAPEVYESFSHTRPNGSSCFTAVEKSYWSMGENIASGYGSPEGVMDGWMNSPGHRGNILGGYKKIGVGYFYNRWVQMFGGELYPLDTLSTDEILSTPMTLKKGTIPAASSSKLLSGTKSADYLRNGTDGVTIQAQGGDDTISNKGASVSIDGGAGDSFVHNSGHFVTIIGGENTDSITNYGGSSVKINGNAGNDEIYNGIEIEYKNYNETTQKYETFEVITPDKVTISGGAGNDSITNKGGAKVRINGEAGNDWIANETYVYSRNYNATLQRYETEETFSPDNATITGGSGNDSIKNYGNNVSISGGDDNDTISNRGVNTTIKGGAGKDILINSGYWSDEKGGSNVSLIGEAGNDTIISHGLKSFLYGGTGNDSIINGYRYYEPSNTFYDPDDENHNGSNSTINSGAGNDYIKNCGNNVSVVASTGNDSIYNVGSNVKINAGTGNDYIYNISSGSDMTINVGAGNDTVENSANKVSIKGGTGNDFITNWGGTNVTINAGAGNDTLVGTADIFFYADGDGNDVFTSYDSNTTINLTSGSIKSSSLDGSDVILNIGNGSIRLEDSKDKKITIKDAKGKVTSKTYANANLVITGTKGNDTLTAGKGSNITISGDAGNDHIQNNGGSKVKILGGDGKDILINGGYWEEERGGKNATLSGGKGNDTIISHGLKSSLAGGAGNDSIINGYRYYEPWSEFYSPDSENYNGSNSTISGGTGNDTIKNCGNNVVFKYKAGDGKDYIQGFNATSTLNISGSVYSTQTSNNDVIVTIGKGKVTLSGATDLSALNIKCDKVLNLTDKSKSKVTVASAVEFVNASARTKAVKITGNELNNSIVGGSGKDSIAGRAGNDTLRGGAGNDKLWGGIDADTFIYNSGDGQDIIYGFDNTDMLQITGTFSTSYNQSKKEIYFKVGSTAKAITLKNYTATTFNVNGDAYHISGKKLVK